MEGCLWLNFFPRWYLREIGGIKNELAATSRSGLVYLIRVCFVWTEENGQGRGI